MVSNGDYARNATYAGAQFEGKERKRMRCAWRVLAGPGSCISPYQKIMYHNMFHSNFKAKMKVD